MLCACRLEQLVTLFVHKNNLTYLPQCLCNISTLKMIVVSGDELNCIPTKLCSSPEIKYTNAATSQTEFSQISWVEAGRDLQWQEVKTEEQRTKS